MKAVLGAVVALTFFAALLADDARAQSEPAPLPAPNSATQPFPGIVVTPPRVPPADAEHSCPATGKKLELIV
jgi:hypothetical protein